jgi:8-oxo-dGTP pyrophosphatase MutT (NUDIX family)
MDTAADMAMTANTAGAATTERFRAAVAVYGVLTVDGRILLMRRAGSGYHDGELSLPAGHLDPGEDVRSALIRELREELRIEADPAACTPVIGEPERCSELSWTDPDALPDDVIPYIAEAVRAVRAGQRLFTGGWAT